MFYKDLYNQYNSLILPLQKYLKDNGVNFVNNTTVTDIDFEDVESKKRVITLYLKKINIAFKTIIEKDKIEAQICLK